MRLSLSVAAPVRQIYLTVEDRPATDADAVEPGRSTPARLRFVAGEARYVRCVAVGGYPAPSLHVYVNDRDVTASTRLRSRVRVAVDYEALHTPPLMSERTICICFYCYF